MSNGDQVVVQYSDPVDDDGEAEEEGVYANVEEDEEREQLQREYAENYDDDDDSAPAFQFTIGDPSKSLNGKSLSYWVYKISTRTTLSSFKAKAMVVRRRFSHFVWLRMTLVEDFPGCVVPPIPEKSILGTVEKFVSSVDTKGLLEYRQRALTKFLTRVGEHQILQNAEQLKAFAEMKFDEFESYKKQKDIQLKQKKSPLAATSGWFKKSLTKEPKWITQQRIFIQKLEESLKNLKMKLQDMVKKRKDMSGAISEFGKAFKHLGLVERGYEDCSLSTSLIELSNKSEQLSLGVLSQAERETMQVVETITYYLGMCDSMKRIMKKLETMRLERDDATNTLRNQQSSVMKIKKGSSSQENPKLKQAEDKQEAIEQRVREAEENLSQSETFFRNDIERFDMERRVDFAYMLQAFVNLQIEYSVSVRSNWESIIPSLNTLHEQ